MTPYEYPRFEVGDRVECLFTCEAAKSNNRHRKKILKGSLLTVSQVNQWGDGSNNIEFEEYKAINYNWIGCNFKIVEGITAKKKLKEDKEFIDVMKTKERLLEI